MRHKLLTLALLLCAALSVQAQDTKKMYLVKGNSIVGTYPVADVEYITFTQPSDAVQTEYAITANDGLYYTMNCPDKAKAGRDVIFAIDILSAKMRVDSVRVDGDTCEYITDDGTTWYYKFTMPKHDVTISVTTGIDWHTITPIQGEHTTLTMLNSSDDWDKAPEEQKFTNVMEKLVKFQWAVDLGYDGTLKITTKSGQDVEYFYVDDDLDFGTCWECVMPDEDIIIETTATEKTDYVGRAFVGQYKGYAITVADGGVSVSSVPSFTMSLKANTSFTAVSTDENAYDFDGCYTFDESASTFKYDADKAADMWGKKDNGLGGTWFTGGDAWIYVLDLNEDKPENTRYYIASTTDFSSAIAAGDTYGSRFLLELQRSSGKTYYYFDKLTGTIEPVTLSFASGSSIAEASSALVYDASGQPLFRYGRTSATAFPTFTMKGSEAGSYTPATGSGSTLTLDGFGGATYGTQSGTYTISSGVVTFVNTATGATQTFVIDTTAKTYTTSSSSTWDGAESFAAAVTGVYDDNSASSGMVAITLNHDYAGNEAEGKAKVQATLTNSYYQSATIIASTATYVYDASASTITFSGILVGTANGNSTERISVTFDVAADKQSMTCNEDKTLRAASGGNTRYISLKGLTLTAR